MNKNKTLLFFDGNCSLCNGIIQLTRKFKFNKVRMVPSQNKEMQIILEKYDVGELVNNTIVLIHKKTVYTKSEAVIKLLELNNVNKYLIGFLRVVPKSFFDRIYNFIAENRFKMFGTVNSCCNLNLSERSNC